MGFLINIIPILPLQLLYCKHQETIFIKISLEWNGFIIAMSITEPLLVWASIIKIIINDLIL